MMCLRSLFEDAERTPTMLIRGPLLPFLIVDIGGRRSKKISG